MRRILPFLKNDLPLMIRWFVKLSRGIRLKMTVVILFGLMEVLAALAFIWATKRVMDIASHASEGDIKDAAFVASAILIFQLILQTSEGWLNGMFPSETSNAIRSRLFRRLMHVKWNELERYHTGDIVSRLNQDVGSVSSIFTSIFPNFIITGFQFITALFYLKFLDARLAWTLIIVFPCFLLLSKLYVEPMRKYAKAIREDDARIQSLVQESLRHRVVIKTFEKGEMISRRLIDLQELLLGNIRKRTRLSLFSQASLASGFSVGYLLVFLWGAFRLDQNAITFGTMTAFLQLIGRVQRPAADLVLMLPSFIGAWVSAERIREVEDMNLEENLQEAVLQNELPSGVILREVSFKYRDGSSNVLSDLSYDFQPGSCTAVVGETGAGKTTLLRLLLGLIDPHKGRIDLYSPDSDPIGVSYRTRRALVYVPQGNTLLSGSVRDNLLLGKPDASDTELEHVLQVSCAHFYKKLPDGIDTLLTEGGGGLSEGQAQRIAIARSLLRPGNIMLFDEITSALDSETELKVLQNIRKHFPSKTLIYITHHPLLVEQCDGVLRIG